jgi:hypothetical protein
MGGPRGAGSKRPWRPRAARLRSGSRHFADWSSITFEHRGDSASRCSTRQATRCPAAVCGVEHRRSMSAEQSWSSAPISVWIELTCVRHRAESWLSCPCRQAWTRPTGTRGQRRCVSARHGGSGSSPAHAIVPPPEHTVAKATQPTIRAARRMIVTNTNRGAPSSAGYALVHDTCRMAGRRNRGAQLMPPGHSSIPAAVPALSHGRHSVVQDCACFPADASTHC